MPEPSLSRGALDEEFINALIAFVHVKHTKITLMASNFSHAFAALAASPAAGASVVWGRDGFIGDGSGVVLIGRVITVGLLLTGTILVLIGLLITT